MKINIYRPLIYWFCLKEQFYKIVGKRNVPFNIMSDVRLRVFAITLSNEIRQIRIH